MTFDGIKVEHGKLDQGSADVMAAAKDIEARLDNLEDELKPLASDWTGAAKEAYREAKATWDKAIADMIVLLEQARPGRRHVQRGVQGRRHARCQPLLIRTTTACTSGRSPFGAAGLVVSGRTSGRRPTAAVHIGCSRSASRPLEEAGRSTWPNHEAHGGQQHEPDASVDLGLVRVTIASGSRRVDLVLPGVDAGRRARARARPLASACSTPPRSTAAIAWSTQEGRIWPTTPD